MKKSWLVAIGGVCLFLAIYFFPLGQDVVNKAVIDGLAGGDYWTGMFYLYLITSALAFIGIAILRPGFVYATGKPWMFVVLYLIFLVIVYLVTLSLRGT